MLQGWCHRLRLLMEGPPPGKFCSQCLAVSTTHSTAWCCPGSGRAGPSPAGRTPACFLCLGVSLAHMCRCLAALGALQPLAGSSPQGRHAACTSAAACQGGHGTGSLYSRTAAQASSAGSCGTSTVREEMPQRTATRYGQVQSCLRAVPCPSSALHPCAAGPGGRRKPLHTTQTQTQTQSWSHPTAIQRVATPTGTLIGSLTTGPVPCSLQGLQTLMKSGTGLP